MTKAPRWIDEAVALAIHDEQLAQHGGGRGLRDAGLLASALSRPQQLAAYGEPDVFDLAAAYAFGVARNHPFVDGNKRTAWVLARLLLRLHGHDYGGGDVAAVMTMLQLAAGDIDQDGFAAWLRQQATAAKR
ncbi:MAG: type II toxin-antitoxin system death-on-curing family toxin [Xanthomonadales bacterium]|nr:type II toxin-antitoxin system death-on-curing family toxin [Xanthomonadales bacterium]